MKDAVDLVVKYTIDSFNIINTQVYGNLLKISLKSKKVITLEFSNSNEAKLALIRLREQIDTLTNKSIDLGSNTLTGTIAEFNTALTDGDFATLNGIETLSNKTLASPVISPFD